MAEFGLGFYLYMPSCQKWNALRCIALSNLHVLKRLDFAGYCHVALNKETWLTLHRKLKIFPGSYNSTFRSADIL